MGPHGRPFWIDDISVKTHKKKKNLDSLNTRWKSFKTEGTTRTKSYRMVEQPREASSVGSVKTLLTLQSTNSSKPVKVLYDSPEFLSVYEWLFVIICHQIWLLQCKPDFCNLSKRLPNFCFIILYKNNNPHPIGLPERWLNKAEPFCSLLKIQYPIPSIRIHLWIHLHYFVEATYKW